MLRQFDDGTGRRWRVWAVAPDPAIGRRRAGERRRESAPAPVLERRGHADRRVRPRGAMLGVAPALADGWLAFEADPPHPDAARRRLAPIPDDWEWCSDDALRDYLGRAERAATGGRGDG